MRLPDDPNYTRLPGGSRSILGPAQYWLARDHLLLVEVVWLVEKYRRFDLKDLEALTVRPTWTRVWIWSALSIPMAIGLGLGIYLWREETQTGSLVVAGILVGLAIALGGICIWLGVLGPGCEVRLTTSVQSIVLPGLRFRAGAARFRAALLAALAALPHLPPDSSVGVGAPDLAPTPDPTGEAVLENPAGAN